MIINIADILIKSFRYNKKCKRKSNLLCDKLHVFSVFYSAPTQSPSISISYCYNKRDFNGELRIFKHPIHSSLPDTPPTKNSFVFTNSKINAAKTILLLPKYHVPIKYVSI